METHLCNAYTCRWSISDGQLRSALLRADLNLCDGTPLSWIGRPHGLSGPVRGSGARGRRRPPRRPHRCVTTSGEARRGSRSAWQTDCASHAPSMRGGRERVSAVPTDHRQSWTSSPSRISGRRRAGALGRPGTPKQDYIVPRLADRVSIPSYPWAPPSSSGPERSRRHLRRFRAAASSGYIDSSESLGGCGAATSWATRASWRRHSDTGRQSSPESSEARSCRTSASAARTTDSAGTSWSTSA